VEAARVIAAHASVVLAYARAEQNLWRAIDTRSIIGQAQGILMERYRLTAASAFEVLRRCSQQQNVKVAVLAEQLATTGQIPGLPPGHRRVVTTPPGRDNRVIERSR
jgi:AmiR/NasT family two-component response regulator